jgi:hypothetical protein
VVAFNGNRGSQESNLSAANPSRPRPASATGSSLQVSQWRLDSPGANAQASRAAGNAPAGKTGSPAPGPGAAASSAVTSSPRRTAAGGPASTFFAEAAPGTIVEITLPDYGGPSSPLIGPLDLVHMKNAIVTTPKPVTIPPKPIKEVTIPPKEYMRESPRGLGNSQPPAKFSR